MCKLEEEMQQARKEFAAEKQKLTEELVCTYLFVLYIIVLEWSVLQDETKSEHQAQMDENRKIGK